MARIKHSAAVIRWATTVAALLAASGAQGMTLTPLSQSRTLDANYTARNGTPGGCIPGLCIPDEIESEEVSHDERVASDFGPFNDSVKAGTAVASSSSRITAHGLEFAATIAGDTPVLDFANSAARFDVHFELASDTDILLSGTLAPVIPDYFAGSSFARVWLEDGAGVEVVSFIHPPGLCPDISELMSCTAQPFLHEGTLPAGTYRLAAELTGQSSYWAKFDIPGTYEAHLDFQLQLVPEPTTGLLLALGLTMTAAMRRSDKLSPAPNGIIGPAAGPSGSERRADS